MTPNGPAPGQMEPADAAFVAERARLEGIAYRLLGSRSDAEDVVSDAYLRWRAAGREGVRNPAAFLTTVTTRLALDRLRSAARERERYVGPWLAEPLPTDPGDLPAADAPDDAVLLAESLTLGFLAVLERLDPTERAAFLLREVYGEPYSVLSEALGRTPAACRQIVHRARERVRGGPRFLLDRGRAEALAVALGDAIASDDPARLGALLHEDVVLVSDGGSNRRAARRPVLGRVRVSRLLTSIARRTDPSATIELRWLNHEPAYVVRIGGEVDSVLALALAEDGASIREVHVLRNPAKLRLI